MSTRMRNIFYLAIIFGGSLLLISINNISVINVDSGITTTNSILYTQKYGEQTYTIKTDGCTIPALKAMGEEIKKFVKYPALKKCPTSNFALLTSNTTHIWVRNENKIHYNISLHTVIRCCYMSFFRPKTVQDVTSLYVDDRVNYSDCKYFSDSIKVNDEFVTAYCEHNKTKIYQQYYLFTPKKKTIFRTASSSLNKTSYNIIVMGVDSVSRLNFHRTMPKTLATLKEFGAVELLGYNKVGDNTFPNLIPMLMGMSVKELKYACLPHKKSNFDNCPFIWGWFKEAGYHTAFGEDSSSLGTFNYGRSGFIQTPTDYYIHTFIHEAEKKVGMNKDLNSFLCMHDKYFFTVLLEYIEHLTSTLRSSKLFGFFWETTMSHDFATYPMVMDTYYEDFLKKLYDSGYLNETIIFFVSDHGIRWGNFRSTNQGRLEERLPFVYILAPKSFREKYSIAFNNLQVNSHHLTTPYDLHATFIDLLDLSKIDNNVINLKSNDHIIKSKGYSLFSPIPGNRTCAQAYIDDHWCSCHKSHLLSTKSKKALDVAQKFLQKINMLLKDYNQCAQLKIVDLLEIREMELSSSDNDKIEWREYTVTIKTIPGNGLFEGTIKYDGNNWSLTGTVSRLNLYGNQSCCVHDSLLKLYCYCLYDRKNV